MPLYDYRAYDSAGSRISGLVDAPSTASAFSKLKSQGIFPTELKEETGGQFRTSVPTEEMIFCLDQMATLLKAGIPLPEALDTLARQVGNDSLRRGLSKVKVHLEEGDSFASALASEGIFPPLLVKMVDAAESVGTVDMILKRYSEFLSKESSFKEKVISAMLYPGIIMTSSAGLIFFILTYIAPTLVKVFESFHTELPLPTRIVVGAGTFMKDNSILIFLSMAILIFTYLRILPRKIKDAFLLKIPVVGQINTYVQMSRWARTLSMLHGGGVSLIKALSSSREVVENTVMSEQLKSVEEYVQRGHSLGAALARVPTVPQILVQMTRSGEKSGELESLLNTAANFYEKEVDRKLTIFFKFLEPAAIIVLGLVVGFVVVSALLPIFEINQMIK